VLDLHGEIFFVGATAATSFTAALLLSVLILELVTGEDIVQTTAFELPLS
jgi:hypothetical protein